MRIENNVKRKKKCGCKILKLLEVSIFIVKGRKLFFIGVNEGKKILVWYSVSTPRKTKTSERVKILNNSV